MTHCERVLALLSDGKPHTHHELYGLHVIAHSRVADLRKQGHHIACWTANDHGERVSVYQLLPSLPGPEPQENPNGSSSAVLEYASPSGPENDGRQLTVFEAA